MTSVLSKNIVFVCRQPPYGNALAREAIDIALATAVYEQNVSILFMGDGVWQLHEKQNSEAIGAKNLQKTVSALPIYDITNIYVDSQALEQRKISEAQLSVDTSLLTYKEISVLLDQADVILNF